MLIGLGWRLLQREFRQGELSIILLAIALAVTSVYSLAGFAERLQGAIEQRSSQFLAADRVLKSAHPIASSQRSALKDAVGSGAESLRTAELIQFATMVYAEDAYLLAAVKAADPAYPLRGTLLVRHWNPERKTLEAPRAARGPKSGEVWVSARLPDALQVQPGDQIELGSAELRIAGIIESEPDASFNVFSMGPRVIISSADLEKTGVIQPGSRVSWRLLFAGDADSLRSLDAAVKPLLQANQEWEDIRDSESPLAGALDRAEKFLLLASLLGIVLAATAIAVAARRYTERHYDPVAVMKTLGFSRRDIRLIYVWQLAMIATAAILAGLLAGWLLQELALWFIRDQVGTAIPDPGMRPALIAVLTGALCAAVFSLLPLRQLLGTPPMRVIRRALHETEAGYLRAMLIAAGAVYVLMWLFSGDGLLSTALLAGALAIGLVLLLLGRALVWLGRRATAGRGGAPGLAMANLYRGGQATVIQIVSFALAIMLLITIVILRGELIAGWQKDLPAGTPNHFLVNISPDEIQPLTTLLAQHQIERSDLYPVVRGRLTAINGERVTDAVTKDEPDPDERGRAGVGRELNLTWTQSLPELNTLVAGDWWQAGGGASVSVEEEVARELDIEVGDRLKFLIGGLTREATVRSLRAVNWNAMRPTFYMIFSPDALQDLPATYIGSFFLPAEQKAILNQLLRAHPTVTVIEVDALIKQIQEVIDQVSLALQYILALVVGASLLVLLAQIRASFDQRRKELVIIRTLGASSQWIRRVVTAEFVLLGLLSGILAALAAELTLLIIQTRIMDMQWVPHWRVWILSGVLGAVVVGTAGRLACRELLVKSTLVQMRKLE